MQKLLILTAISLLFIFSSSCKEDKDENLPNLPVIELDTIAPELQLLGPNPYNIVLNEKYIEHAYSVSDNFCDSTGLMFNTSNLPDVAAVAFWYTDEWTEDSIYLEANATIEAGEFEVIYTAIDTSGNTSSVSRTVIVENEASYLAQNYSVKKECLTDTSLIYDDYSSELTIDNNINGRLWIPRFLNLEFYSLNVYVNIQNDSIFLPKQVFNPQNGYQIKGIENSDNGFAGMFNQASQSFTLTLTASNVAYSNDYKLTFTKQN